MVRRRQLLSTIPVAESISLPLADQNLLLHTRRAHLQMLLWKAVDKDKSPATVGDHGDNTNFGWEVTQDGAVMPSISDQQVAPAQLLDIMSCGQWWM